MELVVLSGQGRAPNYTLYDLGPGLPFISEHWIDEIDFQWTTCLAIGDTNSDGLDDIEIAGAGTPDRIWEYRQEANGTFPLSPFEMPMSEYAGRAMIAPIDCADDLPDLVVIHTRYVGVYHQEPFGLFSEYRYDLGTGVSNYDTDSGFDLADAGGDGVIDIFVANYNVGLLWLRGECMVAPSDSDGDTVLDDVDCDPDNPSVWAPPRDASGLRVRWVNPESRSSLRLMWMSEASASGPGTTYQVAGGTLGNLWTDYGYERAACIAPTVVGTSFETIDPGSRWYLARAVACGMKGTYGTSAGSTVNYRAYLESVDPCP
jgi:hypothetical protein